MTQDKPKADYLDANPEDFGEAFMQLIAAQRATYMADKEARGKITAYLKQAMPVDEGREVSGTTYTRWGQFQVIVGFTKASKTAGKARPTLAQYLEQRKQQGLTN